MISRERQEKARNEERYFDTTSSEVYY